MKYQAVIYTAGHSNKPFDSFVSLLLEKNVQVVIDCRTKPRSRWSHFNRNALASRLNVHGIGYEFRGLNIGGLGLNVQYAETLDELAYRAECGELMVLICSEANPNDCHRGTLLTPELEVRGVIVEHLLYAKPDNNMRLL